MADILHLGGLLWVSIAFWGFLFLIVMACIGYAYDYIKKRKR